MPHTPSHLHEGLLDLFRTDLLLAPSLLAEEFRIPLPGLSQMRAEPCDFTDVGPKEFRGDLALITHDHRDMPVLGVCVEVQLSKADVRRWKWPVYLTTLRSRLCCPVVLLVVTPSRKVAKWAEQPKMYLDLVDDALTVSASRRLEELMESTPQYRGRIATKYVAKGREEGRTENAAHAVLTVLTARGLELSAAQRAQLAACSDFGQLDAWLTQAVTVTSTDELFG